MSTVTRAGEIGVQLARRRAASRRLEPLECGHVDRHRDPLSCMAEFESPPVATYCCSGLAADQVAALARLGRYCTETSCARLAAS